MHEAYEAVAPQLENWPKLMAKAAEHASNFSGIPPEAIQAIQAPALVIVADGDIVRIEHAEELARLLRSELVILPDSDHVSYLLEHSDVTALETRGVSRRAHAGGQVITCATKKTACGAPLKNY
jgi:pimeloyl-ACP methyl ester carboxylesterase